MNGHSLVKVRMGAAVLALLAGAVAGCSSDADKPATGANSSSAGLNGKTVTYISAATNSFTQCIGGALQKRLVPTGARFVQLSSNFSASQQQKNVQDAITAKTAAVVLLGISSELDVNAIKALGAAKIPVVYLVNLVPSGAQPPAFISVDTGKLTAAAIAELPNKAPGATKIAYIDGIPGIPTNNEFIKAVEDGITKLGGNYKILGHIPGKYSEEGVPAAAQQLLQKYPDMQTLVINGSAGVAGATRILDAAGRKDVKVVVIGAITKGDYQALSQGRWTYAVAESAPDIGTDAGTSVEKLLSGGQGIQRTLDSIIVDKSNLSEAPPACG